MLIEDDDCMDMSLIEKETASYFFSTMIIGVLFICNDFVAKLEIMTNIFVQFALNVRGP